MGKGLLTAILLGVCGMISAQESSGSSAVLDKMRDVAVADSMRVYSICEIKDGVSRTVDIEPASKCHTSYSVTKVFVVTAIGILEDRGILSTEELVYPIFKEQFPVGFDPKWQEVTIDHALRHCIGFEQGFLDIDCEDIHTYGSDDFLALVLGHPLKWQPGEKGVYSDAAYYLLSRIVSAKTGQKLDDFLREELLKPLHFSEYAFSKCPNGYPIGATGLYISTTDMAKLGQLYLQKGKWEGKTILSERFVDKALGRYELGGSPQEGFAKGGMLGQYLYLDPVENRVIAIHSYNGDIGKLMQVVREK